MARTSRKNQTNKGDVAMNYRVGIYLRLSLVKDLSRLGRNAIETGYYIQQFFPSHSVRFISILEDFDTVDGITNIDDTCMGIRIPMINILNQAYTDDIKRKTEASIDTEIKDGDYLIP